MNIERIDSHPDFFSCTFANGVGVRCNFRSRLGQKSNVKKSLEKHFSDYTSPNLSGGDHWKNSVAIQGGNRCAVICLSWKSLSNQDCNGKDEQKREDNIIIERSLLESIGTKNEELLEALHKVKKGCRR